MCNNAFSKVKTMLFVIKTICIIVALLSCSVLAFAQAAASGRITTMTDGVSLSVVAWVVGVIVPLITGAAYLNYNVAKMSQRLLDHVCNENIHPSRKDLDELYVRRDICDVKHKEQ